MKHLLAILALSGIEVVSAFALRERYRTDTSPCSINERWDCGIVNHSPYATLGGIRLPSSASPDTSSWVCSPCVALIARFWPPPSQVSLFHFTSRTSRPTF